MKNKLFMVSSLTVMIAAWLLAAPVADTTPPKKTEKGCCLLEKIPNLTPDQKAKIEKLNQEHHTQLANLMAEMKKKCAEHRTAITNILNDEQKKAFEPMGCGESQGCCQKMAKCQHGKTPGQKQCPMMKKPEGKGCPHKTEAHKSCDPKACSLDKEES